MIGVCSRSDKQEGNNKTQTCAVNKKIIKITKDKWLCIIMFGRVVGEGKRETDVPYH